MRTGALPGGKKGFCWRRLTSLTFLLLVAAVVVAIAVKRDFADLGTLGNAPIQAGPPDGVLRVAVLGDSWAAKRKIDDQLAAALRSRGHRPEVYSFGVPGAKTKDILFHLRDPTKSGSLLDGRGLDYAVIFAGVNDSNGHEGPDFYSHHMDGILRVLRHHEVVPVVLDIPDFGIGQMAAPSWLHHIKRIFFRILFDTNPPGNLAVYREALRKILPTDRKVVLVPADALPSFQQHPELWRDPAHLNERGYAQAAEVIADAIHSHIAVDHATGSP